MRAMFYLRVSTTKQAEKDLSIPDQRKQLEGYCNKQGWNVVGEYLDAGASATGDKRPSFQRMVDDATARHNPFDVIVVHSFSRFYRDTYEFEYYRRKLEKAGVELVSITQHFSNDPAGEMIRNIVTMFDEYSSKETAKHVKRAMKENARQGFWNGSRPPFGYKTTIAEWRGDRPKKVLEVDAEQAKTVKMVFDLYIYGDGTKGPLGVKSVCTHLNSRSIPYIGKRKFSVQAVSTILGRTTYIGKHHFNKRDSRTGKIRKRSEWVELSCPPIISPELFAAVQNRLKHNNPKMTPPRIVNGPTLLTGIATCGHCKAPMRLRTGKSGRYRYYTCSKAADKGKASCKGISISMPKLDDIVLSELENRIFEPKRLSIMLEQLAKRATKDGTQISIELTSCRQQKRQVENKLDNLYEAIETGGITSSKRLMDRIEMLQRELDTQSQLIRQKEALAKHPQQMIDQPRIESFAAAMRERLHTPNKPQFRKAYVRLFLNNIIVEKDRIILSGPKQAISQAIMCKEMDNPNKVPTFAQDWCTRQDSNL